MKISASDTGLRSRQFNSVHCQQRQTRTRYQHDKPRLDSLEFLDWRVVGPAAETNHRSQSISGPFRQHSMIQQPKAKRQRDITTVDEFYMMAKEVRRRSGQKISSAQTEDRRFRDFFGVGVHVGIITCTLLYENYLLPEGAIVPHLLWTLYFLCCYPKQE